LLFQPFNGGEEFEDHQENQDEAGEDDGVDVTLHADQFGDGVGEVGVSGDNGHSAPNDDPDQKFQDCLVVFTFQKIHRALKNHHGGNENDGDLVEVKGKIHRFIFSLSAPRSFYKPS